MPDTKQLLRQTRDRVAPPPDVLGGLERRRRHKENVRRVTAVVVGIVVAVAGITGWLALSGDGGQTPADDRSQDLGIFGPVEGRILYVNEDEDDLGYDVGVWAIDPSGPSDTVVGRTVADDVASTLVRLGADDMTPLGWSSDGTELLSMRTDAGQGFELFPEQYLYVLHADGTETQLNEDPMYFGGATISPDGTRVVFAVQAVPADDLGLYVVDAEGGRPVRLPTPAGEGIVVDPTFSPDGTRIAYVDSGEFENHVWVMDADGGNAHEILTDEPTVPGGNLQWSPAGGRIAGQARLSNGDNVIYTFAPDGSDFAPVIAGGLSPYWSPDGSQIAYTIECDLRDVSCGGLAIADADGSDVREYGFAASGPWHPGASVEGNEPEPTAGENFARANGEVLDFRGNVLVAVNPIRGGERVLAEDLPVVYSARWSADGRWVAYETPAGDGYWNLWILGSAQEPRLVATGGDPDMFASLGLYWIWSPTGAHLATIAESTLQTIDLTSGETTDLGDVVSDLLSNSGWTWAWSSDGSRIAFGDASGAIYTVDVQRGGRSLLVRLPKEDLPSIDEIVWSPDGGQIAVVSQMDEGGRLYVIDADGSNVRVLDDDYDPLGVAWSPDGTRLAFAEGSRPDEVRIWVAPMDGAAPSEIGSLPFAGCRWNYECDLTWSPDGSGIAFHKDRGDDSAFSADGSGEVEPIDELTFRTWAGGSYSCECT